jgi:hypothetical protein
MAPYDGQGIRIAGPDWFGPARPLAPLAPQDVTGRSWDFPTNYNLNITKRPYEPISWETLKALANGYDLLRIVIETRKDQMARQRPHVVPKDPKAKAEGPIAARIAAAEKLIEEPYPGIEWDEWLRRILEDLFVLDAPVVYPRKTIGGQPYGFLPMDGSLFNRVLDPWGNTPDNGAAYVQILKGVGAVHYTRQDLIYRPRNPRNGRAFGFGPVEQIISLVNIGLRRETWQLNYFTEGNLPDALIGVPMEWTPDQIRNFQDWFDARLSGELGKRRGATFVPGDVARGYVATKETELFGKGEEWLIRVICFAFSISPQGFVAQMNRATAGTAKQTAEEEGLEPIKEWVGKLWNYIFRTYCGWDDIKLAWHEADDTDPKTQAETQGILVDKGIIKRNEARDKLGFEPDPAPEANMLMITTASGVVPVGFDAQMEQAQAKQALTPEPAPGAANDKGGGGKSPPPKGSAPAGGSARGGGGGSAASGQGRRATASGKAAGSPSLAQKRMQSLAALAPIKADRPLARRAVVKIKRAVAKMLTAAGDDIAHQIDERLKAAGKVRKVDEKDGSGSIKPIAGFSLTAGELVDGLDLSSFDTIVDAVDAALFDVASDSALKAVAQVGASSAEGLVDQVNQAAVDWARNRAAELVGKRWTAAGELIDNPNPTMAITETTRDLLRELIAKGLEDNVGRPAIADMIQESFAFSEDRADLIARSEVRMANAAGKMDGWRAAEDAASVELLKGWQTTNNDNCCDECEENEAVGLIPLDDEFPSGADSEGDSHPNCQCVTYVIVANDGSTGEGEQADVEE